MRHALAGAILLTAAVSPAAAFPGPPASGAAAAAPSATAVRIDGPPNDAVWQTVPPITAFVQREPREGAAPTYQTEARIAYDTAALYVAVDAFDPEPAKIVGIRTRRDEDSTSDWITVMVDSFHDR